MRRALALADVPAWRLHRRGDAGEGRRDARVCFGLGARWITRLTGADALVLGRRIFLAPGCWRLAEGGAHAAVALLEHELVHVEQYRRLGWIGFLARYLGEYLAGRLRGRGHWAAYRAISLEREARREAARRVARPPDGNR